LLGIACQQDLVKNVVELATLAASGVADAVSESEVRLDLLKDLQLFTALHNELVAKGLPPSHQYEHWMFFQNFTVNRLYSGAVVPKPVSFVDMIAQFTNAGK
jgi:hypothetical protein